MTGMGAGLTWGSALIDGRGDGRMTAMTQDRVLLPGPGLDRGGDGPRDRRGRARGAGGLRRGSEASGLDLERLCFEAAHEELVDTAVQQPALVATSLALLAALRERGIVAGLRRRPLGRRVRGARRGGSDVGARTRSRSCASAASRWLRRQRSVRARWPRSSGSRTKSSSSSAGGSSASGRRTTTAPARSSSPARTTRSTSAASDAQDDGARRAVKLKVSGAFHSPLVARAAERLRPAIEKIHFKEPVAPFMSTVTARARVGAAHRPAARRPAHRAGPVHAGGDAS